MTFGETKGKGQSEIEINLLRQFNENFCSIWWLTDLGGLEAIYPFCWGNSTLFPTLQEPHWFGAYFLWPWRSSVMSRAKVSLTKLKMVHVRLYSVGRGHKALHWTTGAGWKSSDFDDWLWISKISQFIHLKCRILPGPIVWLRSC